jgi:hypothetical protein
MVDPSDLDPGVRDLVIALNATGWETADSGDGISKPKGERAFDFPHVVVRPRERDSLIWDADLLKHWLDRRGLGAWHVEASYCTHDGVALLTAMCVPRIAGVEHLTEGQACWCGPTETCAECGCLGPCVHGTERGVILIHRQDS